MLSGWELCVMSSLVGRAMGGDTGLLHPSVNNTVVKNRFNKVRIMIKSVRSDTQRMMPLWEAFSSSAEDVRCFHSVKFRRCMWTTKFFGNLFRKAAVYNLNVGASGLLARSNATSNTPSNKFSMTVQQLFNNHSTTVQTPFVRLIVHRYA